MVGILIIYLMPNSRNNYFLSYRQVDNCRDERGNMKGENSIERAKRMIGDIDQEIEFLRGCELDARQQVKELSEQLEKAMQDLENIQDQKMDALYTKMAFMQFIQSGGGLDMFVD